MIVDCILEIHNEMWDAKSNIMRKEVQRQVLHIHLEDEHFFSKHTSNNEASVVSPIFKLDNKLMLVQFSNLTINYIINRQRAREHIN